MILVEKEKKGHTYASTRTPALSDDKKAKMKSFVKDYTHKLLKRLKEKGKLRRPKSSQAESSTPSATPAGTGISDTPSAVIETPDGSNGPDLVADIFGDDSEDEDMDMNADEEERTRFGETPASIKLDPIDFTQSSPISAAGREEPLLIPRDEITPEMKMSLSNGYGNGNGISRDKKAGQGGVIRVDSFRPGITANGGNGNVPGNGHGVMGDTPDRTPSSSGGGIRSPGR
jgi:hypothetical protein